MNRSFAISLAAYALILFGLATLRGDFLALSLPLLMYLLSSYFTAPQEIDLKIERTLSADRVSVDRPVVVTIKVTNQGSSIEELCLVDRVSPALVVHEGSLKQVLYLGKGKSFVWTYTIYGPRGQFPFHVIEFAVNEFFGIAGNTGTLNTSGELYVLPTVLPLKKFPIRTRRTRVYAGAIPARTGGHGVEFFGVREYQAGDSPRLINWRVSARHTFNMYSNEYEQERVADVGVVLDGRAKTNVFGRNHSIFEYSIQASAAMADALLSQGNRVGLLNYGRYFQWTIPGYGKIQRERILQALAAAQIGGSAVFSGLEHLPTRLFPAHSQLILVSPLNEDDYPVLVQLRAHGYQVLIVSPDPVSFEVRFLSPDHSIELAGRLVRMERTLLLRKLQRAGIQVLDWDVSQPFDQVVKQRLVRPPAYWLNLRRRV